ncbi:MAG: 6-O-methylguanine DNA methyltransferase [Melioribacteraceae bacterium]|nr:MAG: 6-O-methylguanine DNA methyltransferase [Melioribacteraceae bacterium]
MKKKNNSERSDFFDKVYEVVARIPYGRVTTYGAIAEFCGVKSAARTVGWALNGAKETGLPCHRVVNRFGALTGKQHFGAPELMRDLLKSEGVEFDSDNNVIMKEYLWHPDED